MKNKEINFFHGKYVSLQHSGSALNTCLQCMYHGPGCRGYMNGKYDYPCEEYSNLFNKPYTTYTYLKEEPLIKALLEELKQDD